MEKKLNKPNNEIKLTMKDSDENKRKIVLRVENVSYRYHDAEEGAYTLRNINYNFENGKIYVIRGRSGAGKTTLLSLITGLEKCTEGDIIFNENNLKMINLDKFRSQEVGIVFQSYNLLPFMTASENIILSMDVSGKKYINKKEKAIELMVKVGLKENYADRKVLKLSGGEQQRVAIARSISYDPKILIADEPTGNLDKQTEDEILEIYKNLAHNENKCVIIVTHSRNVSDSADIVYDLDKIN